MTDLLSGSCLRCHQAFAIGRPNNRPAKVYCSESCRTLAAKEAYAASVKRRPTRRCCWCKREFNPLSKLHAACSSECRANFEANRYIFPAASGIPTSTTGAIGELRVCVDLMERGFHIFRSQSPSCPCDLIAMKGDTILRVEVKMVATKRDGEIKVPLSNLRKNRFDVAALVSRSAIRYNPPLEEIGLSSTVVPFSDLQDSDYGNEREGGSGAYTARGAGSSETLSRTAEAG